jgi:acyl-CoA oxidase
MPPGDPPRSDPVELDWPIDQPGLLPFLPLVQTAWADGILTDAELEALRVQSETFPWLDENARQRLESWLRPERPPSAASLARTADAIRTLGRRVSPGDRGSLADLGVGMARLVGDGPWGSEEARAPLRAMELGLGVAGQEAVRALLAEATPPTTDAPPERAAPFDVEAMRRFLDRPHEELRRRILSLLAIPELRIPDEIERADHRERVLVAVRTLAAEGIGALAFPKEFGGGGSPGQSVAAFETLAFGDISVMVKFGVQFGLFGGSILQLGTRRHHEAYLEDISSLALPGGYAMTESEHGSNVRDIETTATFDPERDAFIVHTPHEGARKDWIGNAALHGRLMTVFARLLTEGQDHGVHAFLVPVRGEDGTPAPGVSIEDRGAKEGLNGIDNGLISFDQVVIPRENLLDRFGGVDEDGRYRSPIPSSGRRFFRMLGTLVAGRISIAAASLSAVKTGLTIAVRYSDRRRQFGPSGEAEWPILDYLTQQRLLLPRLATTYALHFALRELVDRYEAGQAGNDDRSAREVEVLAAGLKAYASRHCVETLQACREACGGRGYLSANRFGRLKADTDVFTTFEGTNVVLLQLVAKGLLSEYREEMGDLKLFGALRWLAGRAETRITQMNPVATRRTDEEHLLDPDFHEQALRYRQERLLASAAGRLKGMIDEGVDTFEVMNRCQDHLVTLAEAWVEHQALLSLQNAVPRAPAPGLSELLRTVGQLYALERMEAHRGWYLESGYFEPPKSRAVRARVNALCGELRELAPFLVDAFGIPDEVLGAPDGLR